MPNWLAINLYCRRNRGLFILLRSDNNSKAVALDIVPIGIVVSARRPGTNTVGTSIGIGLGTTVGG